MTCIGGVIAKVLAVPSAALDGFREKNIDL